MTAPEPYPLTSAEHRAMDLTAELYNLMCREVIGSGTSRSGDISELVGHIHVIQNMILSQAAGRAYPDRYRLLGQAFQPDPPVGETVPDGAR